MAKKKAAKKTATRRVSTRPADVRLAAAEDAAIAHKKEQQALREAVKGIVREVLDDERKETVNYAQERFRDIVTAAKSYAMQSTEPGPGAFTGAGKVMRSPESSNVSAHIDELAAAMANLGDTINKLEDRLEPVMRGGTSTDSSPVDPKVALPINCQVSGRVYDLTNRAEAFRARVDELMFRLQV